MQLEEGAWLQKCIEGFYINEVLKIHKVFEEIKLVTLGLH